MILRGAELSERRRALTPTMTSSVREKATDTSVAGKITSLHAAAMPATEMDNESTNDQRDQSLTFECVVAWLGVQDKETKNACAAMLTDEVTVIHENAKREGFLEGRKSGESAARQEAEQLVTLLQQIALNAQQAFDQEEQKLQLICVEIVGDALAKIAGPLLASEQASVGAVREILSRVKEERELFIRVSRDDIDSIRKLESDFNGLLGNRKYELIADARVELGGCIVETRLGSLDGRFEVQLRELYETLRLAKASSLEPA